MATLKDVAARVGVSTATVSRVLNGTGVISEATRQRVMQAARDLNYIPNEMARSLTSRNNSKILGLIVPYIDHDFFSTLTAAIEANCSRQGYRLLLCTSAGSEERERELLDALKVNSVAGVIVCSRCNDPSFYSHLPMPMVSVERTLHGVPSVSCDNQRGGALAAQELYRAGCRHVLLVGNSYSHSEHLPAHLRYSGFMDECGRLKLDFQECYLEREDLFGSMLAQKLLKQLKKKSEIDGMFVTSDILAAKVQSMLSEKKPGVDISIVGFDGLRISEICDISTIAQPIESMGAMAVDVLIRQINGQLIPEQSILPVSLIRRSSTTARKP